MGVPIDFGSISIYAMGICLLTSQHNSYSLHNASLCQQAVVPLFWLPVKKEIRLKLLLFTAPTYIKAMYSSCSFIHSFIHIKQLCFRPSSFTYMCCFKWFSSTHFLVAESHVCLHQKGCQECTGAL